MSVRSQRLRITAIVLVGVLPLLAQNTKPDSNAGPGLEFPVSLQSKVVAGSTAVGSEVRAKLTMATLVDG